MDRHEVLSTGLGDSRQHAKPQVSGRIRHRPSPADTPVNWLIARRSKVQILPPPPTKVRRPRSGTWAFVVAGDRVEAAASRCDVSIRDDLLQGEVFKVRSRRSGAGGTIGRTRLRCRNGSGVVAPAAARMRGVAGGDHSSRSAPTARGNRTADADPRRPDDLPRLTRRAVPKTVVTDRGRPAATCRVRLRRP